MSVCFSGRRLPCVCLPLLGQAKFNDPASVRACAPLQDSTRSIRTGDYMTLFNCHIEWENNLAVWTGIKPKVKICHDGCYLGRHSPTSDSVCLVVQEREAYAEFFVRGPTGAVLIGLEPAAGESSQDISMCLTKCLPEAGLLQVEHIASDCPSTKLFRALKEICINLEGLSLDPTHAVKSITSIEVLRDEIYNSWPRSY